MSCTAFLIAFGPEVRAFLHSGFIDQYAGNGEALVLTGHPESAVFRDAGYSVVPLPQVSERPILKRFRAGAAGVAERRLEIEGHAKWRHAMPKQVRGAGHFRLLKSALASSSGLQLLDSCEKFFQGISGDQPELEAIYSNHGVSTLYYSVYDNPRTNAAVAAAKRLSIRTICIPNSWKDFFIRPRVTPKPDELWVWDEEARSNYLRINPALTPDQVKVKDSLHLAAVRRHLAALNRDQFCALYGFETSKQIVCYTTAAPNAVVNEELIVANLAKAIQEDARLSHLQLLVRVNPMEVGERYEKALKELTQAAVQRPPWEWLQGSDWCCALEEDVRLWAATLEHMAVNVSVPSTVTLEALEFDKPVINIGFDSKLNEPEESSIRRFWNAPFYRRFHGDQRVSCAVDIEQLINMLKVYSERDAE